MIKNCVYEMSALIVTVLLLADDTDDTKFKQFDC